MSARSASIPRTGACAWRFRHLDDFANRDDMVAQLRALALRHGINARITRLMEELSSRAELLIAALPIDEEQRNTLLGILRYNIERSW